MLRERCMFDEAYAFLEKHYNDSDFGSADEEGTITYEYVELSQKYRGSKLWQSLILDVLDHLERKMKWEKSKNEAK